MVRDNFIGIFTTCRDEALVMFVGVAVQKLETTLGPDSSSSVLRESLLNFPRFDYYRVGFVDFARKKSMSSINCYTSPYCSMSCLYTSHLDHQRVSEYHFGLLPVSSFYISPALRLCENKRIHRLPNSVRLGITKCLPILSRVRERQTTLNVFANIKRMRLNKVWFTLAHL